MWFTHTHTHTHTHIEIVVGYEQVTNATTIYSLMYLPKLGVTETI